MSRLYDDAKRQYQKHLEKKVAAVKERGKTIEVNSAPAPFRAALCFGVVGIGHVFDRWMHDMQMISSEAGIRVKGIAAGKSDAAEKKAKKYGISRVYPDYDTMLQDPEIQAVYVATPNHLHKEHAVRALCAGKHVLCEKPIAVNTAELCEIYATAEQVDRFVMEGMWMRTLPMIRQLKELVGSGEIGAVRYIETACCNSNSPSRFPAMFSREKAGGALMDVGCYGLHFIRLLLEGEPKLNGFAVCASSGVDHTSTALLQFEDTLAVVTQSIGAAGGAKAVLHGTKGTIEVPMFFSPSGFTVTAADGFKTHYRYDAGTQKRPIGYAYEILHFADCISQNQRDSSLIPRSETLAVALQMEQIRRESGITLGSELKTK